MIQTHHPLTSLIDPLFSGARKTQPNPKITRVDSPQITFGSDKTSLDKTEKNVFLSEFIAGIKELWALNYTKKRLVKESASQAKIPEANQQLSELEANQEQRLKNLKGELEKKRPGYLLNGQLNNRQLIEAVCHENQWPLLTENPNSPLSEYACPMIGSTGIISNIKILLDAAEKVARKKKTTCVLYLGDIDALKTSLLAPASPDTGSEFSGLSGESFIRNSLAKHFSSLEQAGKESKVMILFDRKYLEKEKIIQAELKRDALPPESLLRENQLKIISLPSLSIVRKQD